MAQETECPGIKIWTFFLFHQLFHASYHCATEPMNIFLEIFKGLS